MARLISSVLMIVVLFANAGFGAGLTDSLKAGNPELKSAAQLAFGPEGILFVGDSRQAAIFAIATDDIKPVPAAKLEIKGINEKIAAMLGVATDQLLINDVKVNPLSHKVYFAVSRGRGADGVPLILTLDASGKVSEFSLNNVRYSMIRLPDAPAAKPDASVKFPEGMSNANLRVRSISDLSYVDGKVLVSGMSNEDFASDLRSIAFPFSTTAEKSTGIRIWHSAHGRYETAAPIDKFIPYKIDNKQYILASYACTPLVKISVDSLKPGAKVTGSTIAEIGHHNTPLEMFAYSKDGHPYILMAGSTRGVIKLTADNLGLAKAITPPSAQCEASQDASRIKGCDGDVAGVPYTTISELKGVWQMAQLDEGHAVILADRSGAPAAKLVDGHATWFTLDPTATLDLTTIPLP